MIDGITIEIMEDIDYIIDNCILYTKFDYVMNKTYFVNKLIQNNGLSCMPDWKCRA